MDERIRAYKKNMVGETPSEDDWLSKVVEADSGGSPPVQSGFIKVPASSTETSEPVPSSKRERLIKFLAMIGTEAAEKLLSNLPEIERRMLWKEAEAQRDKNEDGKRYGMDAAEARAIYEEFKETLSAPPPPVQPLAFLEDFQGEQIALLLHKEGPQTCAVVLARLPPKLAASALAYIEKEKRQDIAIRIAQLKPVAPEVVGAIAGTLRDRARELGTHPEIALDGVAALAEILKNTDLSLGDKIIENLSHDDPLLGQSLKERLYTLDDVCRAEDKPIAEKLSEMSDAEIVLLVRGRPESFAEKILSNISAGRRAMVREEDRLIGAVLKADTEKAMKEFLRWFRDKREKGGIFFIGEEIV